MIQLANLSTQQAVTVGLRQAHWREVERAEKLMDQALASEAQNKAQSLYSQIQIADVVGDDGYMPEVE